MLLLWLLSLLLLCFLCFCCHHCCCCAFLCCCCRLVVVVITIDVLACCCCCYCCYHCYCCCCCCCCQGVHQTRRDGADRLRRCLWHHTDRRETGHDRLRPAGRHLVEAGGQVQWQVLLTSQVTQTPRKSHESKSYFPRNMSVNPLSFALTNGYCSKRQLFFARRSITLINF